MLKGICSSSLLLRPNKHPCFNLTRSINVLIFDVLIHGSSVVESRIVNPVAVGSNPTRGAIIKLEKKR